MEKLSEWLDVMLGEIARKQGEAAVTEAEQQRRDAARRESLTPARGPSPVEPHTAERR